MWFTLFFKPNLSFIFYNGSIIITQNVLSQTQCNIIYLSLCDCFQKHLRICIRFSTSGLGEHLRICIRFEINLMWKEAAVGVGGGGTLSIVPWHCQYHLQCFAHCSLHEVQWQYMEQVETS
ncbi:hypothetical protein SAY87_016857 [Trapa incisa]|uniref:Uncharacterized protein n=1 Tax=Trapa incisa TaxID=236973 RepID=A0AAN7QXV7_9MYRT|nr:hypothetical protein SAY87_016857 [Trapa incisa]